MEENLIQLLLKDLCGRLPYKVSLSIDQYDGTTIRRRLTKVECMNSKQCVYVEGKDCEPQDLRDVKPYLRPLSSMTEEELNRLCSDVSIQDNELWGLLYMGEVNDMFDFLNANHFDYRGLIKKGIALEAPDKMYKVKE